MTKTFTYWLRFDFYWKDIPDSSWLMTEPKQFIIDTKISNKWIILAHVQNVEGWAVRMAQMDCDSLKFNTREEAKLYCEERLKWRYVVPDESGNHNIDIDFVPDDQDR